MKFVTENWLVMGAKTDICTLNLPIEENVKLISKTEKSFTEQWAELPRRPCDRDPNAILRVCLRMLYI